MRRKGGYYRASVDQNDHCSRHEGAGGATPRARRPAVSAGRDLGRARASISRCSPPTPPRSSSACSTMTATREIERIELPEYTDEVWHGYLPDARPGHGLRLSRARPLRAGRRAIASIRTSCCSIPMPRQLVGELNWDPALFGYTIGSPDDDLSFDERDSAPFMPKCRVIDPAFTWGDERRPQIPWERTIIYETHVRGFTMRHPARAGGAARHLRRPDAPRGDRLPPRSRRHRGRAAADPRLRRRQPSAREGADATTGATTRSASSRRSRATPPTPTSPSPSSRRWWRTSTTPASRSSSTSSTTTPPRATSSGRRCRSRASTTPPTTGCCPTSALLHQRHRHRQHAQPQSHPRVLQMVTDSLRYWAQEMHVDGFRFDLATILAREPLRLRRGRRLPRRLPAGSGAAARSS